MLMLDTMRKMMRMEKIRVGRRKNFYIVVADDGVKAKCVNLCKEIIFSLV